MLKKYNEREIQHAPAPGAAALIDVGERDPEVEGEILIPEFASGETYNDVDVHPGLDADKKRDVEQICEEMKEVLTENPVQTTPEICNMGLIAKEPAFVKGYPAHMPQGKPSHRK